MPPELVPELIESSSSMDELLSRLNNCGLIAVDTEFFRETTYFPQLALVQIATDSIVACIDPLAFDAIPYLKKLLIEQPLTKIFHSCSQDLEVLFYYLGESPTSIYDTQIANALLSDNHQIGYAALVENELNVQLDKSQTRTNWLQRPLTDKQIQYAGDDVIYLYQLHKKLEEKLYLSDRKTWFDEDSSRLTSSEYSFQVDKSKLWKRVKGATKLNRSDLAIVQSIAVWREQLAQKKDKTRKRILSDDLILQLALTPPESNNSLDTVINQKYNSRNKGFNNGDYDNQEKQQLLEAISMARTSPADSWPDNRFNTLDQQQKSLLKNLQQMITTKAEKLGISSAVLSSRKELEKLILFYIGNNADKQQSTEPLQRPNLNITNGWRYQCIGQQLVETLLETLKQPVKIDK